MKRELNTPGSNGSSVEAGDGKYGDYVEAAMERGEVDPFFVRLNGEGHEPVQGEPLAPESPHETAEMAEAARGMKRPEPWKRY